MADNKLDDLSRSLQALEGQTMNETGRSVLKKARQQLNLLIEQLNANQRQGEQQNRLAGLYSVSQALGTSLDLDAVLTQVMDAVIGLTHAERGFLVLLDGLSGEWQLRAARNYSQETLAPKDMEVSHTAINTVIESGQGLLTTDAQTDPRFSERESVIFYALRSILCAPLMAQGQAIGAIYVDNRAQVGMFTKADLDMLSTFASQAAIAIENARLYTRTDQALAQRVAELETLSQVDQELNADLDLNHALELTGQWAMRMSGAQAAWVWLQPDAGSGEDAPTRFPSEGLAADDGLVQQALESGQTQSEARLQSEPDHSPANAVTAEALTGVPAPEAAEATPGGDNYRLAVPLLSAGQTVGALVVARSSAFSAAERSALERLAARASSAIRNARLYQAVQAANTAKTKFVSVVTHELRIPMTSIKGYGDLLKAGVVGALNEQQLSFVNIIRSNVERMSALVSDLADISRIETGRLRIECGQVPVSMYIDEALRVQRPRAEEKEISLSAEITPGLPAVYTDPNRLAQILNNLISNAWKYTPRGGTIVVRAIPAEDAVRIEVTDNGIGISESDQARLFTQFFRSEDPHVREEQGWGLGLSVAYRLAEALGGRMGFSSTFGEGSTFWFDLPTIEGRCIPK